MGSLFAFTATAALMGMLAGYLGGRLHEAKAQEKMRPYKPLMALADLATVGLEKLAKELKNVDKPQNPDVGSDGNGSGGAGVLPQPQQAPGEGQATA